VASDPACILGANCGRGRHLLAHIIRFVEGPGTALATKRRNTLEPAKEHLGIVIFFTSSCEFARWEAGNPSPRLRSRRARTQAGRSFDEITGRWRHARRHTSIQTGLAKRKDCIWSALRPRLPSQMRLPGVFQASISISTSTSRRSTDKSNAKFYLSDWVQHAAGALYTMPGQRCVRVEGCCALGTLSCTNVFTFSWLASEMRLPTGSLSVKRE